MSDVPAGPAPGTIPAEAIEAAAAAVHQFRCPDSEPGAPCLAGPVDADFGYATAALAAAAPVLRAEGAAGERERIRQLLVDYAEVVAADKGGSSEAFNAVADFADLLATVPGQPQPGETP